MCKVAVRAYPFIRSLLVNLLTVGPFLEKAKVQVLQNSDEQGVVHGRTGRSTQVYSSL